MLHSDDLLRRKLLSRSIVDPDTPKIRGRHCRVWTAGTFTSGYASMWDGEQMRLASRLALRVLGGKKDIKLALHHCDNTLCIEPEHLYNGTHADNSSDMTERGRGTRGAKHPRAELTEDQARVIKFAPRIRGSRETLATEFGVSVSLVDGIRAGRNWAWLT